MLSRWILAPLVERRRNRAAPRRGCRACSPSTRAVNRCARFSRASSISSGSRRRSAFAARRRAISARCGARWRCSDRCERPRCRRIAPLLRRVGDFDAMLDDLNATLVDEPPAQIGDGGVIRPEADPELAECVALRTDARSRLSALEAARTRAHRDQDAQGQVRERLRLRDRDRQELHGLAFPPTTSASRR